MSKNEIQVAFVLPSNCTIEETSKIMQEAFEASKQNGIDVIWVNENECLNHSLTKKDVFVFQSFEGQIFEDLKCTKSVVVGPWCLLTCLTEGRKIPNVPWPVYTIAMLGCTISSTSFPKMERSKLEEKIQSMGGFFTRELVTSSTHLVTDTVKSQKYIKAAESGLKIFLSSWVDDVLTASSNGNVHCDDAQFLKHRCPPFYKLVVCCTGLEVDVRNALKQLIDENGGIYKEQLHVASTDILVCNHDSNCQLSAKYNAARKRNIKCVTFDWVKDSIKNGYALPEQLYVVGKAFSTPTKDRPEQPNFSMISNIDFNNETANTSKLMTTIGATIISTTPASVNTLKRKSDSNEHNELVNDIDLKEVKRAGPFLDGCGIYLMGFGSEQREKLCKLLNFSGATRYDDNSERVTHILIGDTSCHELKLMMSKGTKHDHCVVVNIHWLLDSIEKQNPVDEGKYTVNTGASVSINEPSSPLSKKGLYLLRTNSNSAITENLQVDIPVANEGEEQENGLIQQYLGGNSTNDEDTLAQLLLNDKNFNSKQHESKRNMSETDEAPDKTIRNSREEEISAVKPKPNADVHKANSSLSIRNTTDASLSSAVDDSSQLNSSVYQGLKFMVVYFTKDEAEPIQRVIETFSGTVVTPKSYKGIPDYAVVPILSSPLHYDATEIVNDLWISECWQENEIRPIQYYHRPIFINEKASPMKGCVLAISNYVEYERTYLKSLIIQLGGVYQDNFSRICREEDGILASTHLIVPEPAGKKYNGAIKWGLPVVNKDWLLECARTSVLPSEAPFLIGDSKCPPRDTNVVVQTPSASSVNVIDDLVGTRTAPPTNTNVSNINSPVTKLPASAWISLSQQPSTSAIAATNQDSASRPKLQGTPTNKLLKNVSKNSPDVCSQITPVRDIFANARRNNVFGTPPQPEVSTYKSRSDVDTPDTPYGAFIRPNPSPNMRKEYLRYLNTFPDPPPATRRRAPSTPLSELKRQLWDKILPPKESTVPKQPDFDLDAEGHSEQDENICTPRKSSVDDELINNQLQQLQEMITSSGGNQTSRCPKQSTIPVPAAIVKSSQPNTIGWDDYVECYNSQLNKKSAPPMLMFSGIELEKRVSLKPLVENLGGTVTELPNFDPLCTHLICPKALRNEKILACMAAGKWILHSSYIDKCLEEGRLVDEEPYEFGNPKSANNREMQSNKENETRMEAMHYWRKEIAKRGYGPFYDMRAVVDATKRDSIVRIIEAGGGTVVEDKPPFTKPIHATHCLLDIKWVKNLNDYIPLAKQGIFCVNAIYINDFLYRTTNDVRDYIVSSFGQYYT